MRNWFLPSNENTSGHNDSGGLPLVDLSYHLLQPLDTANECMSMYACVGGGGDGRQKCVLVRERSRAGGKTDMEVGM